MSSDSKKKPSNPPAFAMPAHTDVNKFAYGHNAQQGMSLRDYFAGQALVGMMANSSMNFCDINNYDHAVKRAYFVADAMLLEREEGSDGDE